MQNIKTNGHFYFENYDESMLTSRKMQREFLETVIMTSNNSLVHYSLSAKGSALYYQKIMLNKIFRARNASEFILNNSKFNMDGQAVRYLVLGGYFQYAYYWMSNMNQIRRGVSDLIVGNDSGSAGSFKNIAFNRKWFGGSKVSSRGLEPKTVYSDKINQWMGAYGSVTPFVTWIYADNYYTVDKTHKLKSRHIPNAWFNMWTFGKSLYTKSFTEYLSLTFGSLIHFIRTVWYNFTLNLNRYWNQFDFVDILGESRNLLQKTEMYHYMYASDVNFNTFPALGSMPQFNLDMTKNLRAGPRGASFYRKMLRNHKTWRIGMVFWARKIWSFMKTYRFWTYMRGMSNHMFRGFYMVSVFMNRLDVYVMRMFNLKNLRFVRVLINAGHVFYGTFKARNANIPVTRYSIVTISKEAQNWASKRNFKKYLPARSLSYKKASIKNIKNAALRYCRQQKDLAIWGNTRDYRFAMFFGTNLDVMNMDGRKTNFFSLNYFYAQRAVASAWW